MRANLQTQVCYHSLTIREGNVHRHGPPPKPEGSRNPRAAPQYPEVLCQQGQNPHYRNAAGQRLYDVDSYLQGNQENNQEAETVCYCRVSSHQQKDDLQRQVQFMQERFPDANIVTDVGGGLNFQRKGLVSLLERLHRGDKLQIMVAHRDRLARFGFELIQWMAEQNGGEILVLDNTDHSPQQELTEDILAILHTFSCRLQGLRRYRNQIEKDTTLSHSDPETGTETLV